VGGSGVGRELGRDERGRRRQGAGVSAHLGDPADGVVAERGAEGVGGVAGGIDVVEETAGGVVVVGGDRAAGLGRRERRQLVTGGIEPVAVGASCRQGAISRGRRNGFGEGFRWCHPSKGLSRSSVELGGDGIEVVLIEDAEVGAFGHVLAE
jgi:hypothetical protein